MLIHLHIKDFTLVEDLKLDFASGLTVLTGETGAGKSILLDALHLALGDRADADKVRSGAERAEVSASFDVAKYEKARRWLASSDLECGNECILRRVVTREGRSRAYINGQLVTLGQLRALGDQLLDIHSQHEHQSLLKIPNHRHILDAFGAHLKLYSEVKQAYNDWHQLQAQLDAVKLESDELNARYQLLHYQVEELDQLNLASGELEELETKQRQLENTVATQAGCQQALAMCTEGEASIRDGMVQASHALQNLPFKSARINDVISMLENAQIQVEEAASELERELSDGDMEDFNLPEIEARLSAIYEIARKHRVDPQDIVNLHEQLASELAGLSSGDEQLEVLEASAASALELYRRKAAELTSARQNASKKLSKAVNQQLKQLAMAHAQFQIDLRAIEEPSAHGQEQIEFLISTVPGQPAKPLIKIASGGELSRVSLAIQVVAAKISVIPTLVFDEVDVGIGGSTGDVVGNMLRNLGEASQVICVTHLAQVASKSHQHLRVEKTVSKKSVKTKITRLNGDEQILEIARMMGGVIESEQSIAHAREMLEGVS